RLIMEKNQLQQQLDKERHRVRLLNLAAEPIGTKYDICVENEQGELTRITGPISTEISTLITAAIRKWNRLSVDNFQTMFLSRPMLPSLQCIDRRIRKSSSFNYLQGENRVHHYACFNCVKAGKPCVRLPPAEERPFLYLLPPDIHPSDAKKEDVAAYVRLRPAPQLKLRDFHVGVRVVVPQHLLRLGLVGTTDTVSTLTLLAQ
ncbi:hypothetical protein M8818_001142, partial [Zalaria obscura]